MTQSAELHHQLLEQAWHLVTRERKHPRQASLRRAISAAYYALFHLPISEATGLLLPGPKKASMRKTLGRTFQHGEMKSVAHDLVRSKKLGGPLGKLVGGQSMPPELLQVAATFEDLQEARHEADYDTTKVFTPSEATDWVQKAESAFSDWNQVRGTDPAEVFLLALLTYRKFKNR